MHTPKRTSKTHPPAPPAVTGTCIFGHAFLGHAFLGHAFSHMHVWRGRDASSFNKNAWFQSSKGRGASDCQDPGLLNMHIQRTCSPKVYVPKTHVRKCGCQTAGHAFSDMRFWNPHSWTCIFGTCVFGRCILGSGMNVQFREILPRS